MHHVFYLKFFLAAFALLVSLFLIHSRSPLLNGRPHLAIIIYYIARLALLAVALLAFHFGYPAENMSMYYFDAEIVLRGALVNRDFFTLYGILFPYALAGAVWVWHNQFAIMILLQVVEFAAVYSIFTQRNLALDLRAFLIFAFNPLLLVWIWLSAANQVMCLIAVAVAFAVRSETARSLMFALTFASSKVFALWTIIPALLCQRVRSWFTFAVGLALIYVPFLLAGSVGISFKATEASGFITDNTNHTGVLSLVALIPVQSEATLTRPILMLTAALLLVVMLAAFGLKFRLDLGTQKGGGTSEKEIIFVSVFASLLTMVYQAFATYTIPDYMLGMIIFIPFLVEAKFWTKWDQVLIAVVCYAQTVVFLTWFHFAEFGNDRPRTSALYIAILIVENLLVYLLCGRCAWRAWTYYAPKLRRA